MLGLLRNLFNYNEREIRRLSREVERINALEPEMVRLTDAELRAKTDEFRRRLADGETLDNLLHEAFAVVREAARRVLGMRPFDVQLMGGIVLHEGKVAEMKTGEGKTLVATLPAYLNALTGRGVHIVTVNDYLAKRDAEWMGRVYRFLGLSVGVIVHGLTFEERRRAYAADITYGTNNEFGFDYLRDNMALYPEQVVQRELHYAIVDEVDSILIDEARTPLIISGMADKPTELYYRFAEIARKLERDRDYTVDEKARTVAPTEGGVHRVEQMLGVENLYAPDNPVDYAHYLINALKAKELMKRDVDYVVKDGQVIIVDEFTGRLMFGRRYSDGLHQAIEAKEGLKIERETQTLATITFQNYFRMYEKLAGMTGTAATEEEEFSKIYGLDVVVIPTNKPMIRRDYPDVIYKTEAAKFRAVVEEIVECHRRGQPVLVGTVSIEKSERLSEMLKRRGIPHQVLNAKYHEREAEIIAQAGRVGAVTIATNMAGRGTDILLGGNPEFLARQRMRKLGYPPEVISAVSGQLDPDDPELAQARRDYLRLLEEAKRETEAEHRRVVELGGLHIIGTERHESRRIDNQLRGRAGRQGDPGSSRFYLSLEDDLLRLFGSDSIRGIMDRLGVEEDEPIEHPLITRAIENAQRKVEHRNFTLRKQVLEYDDVMNKQREVIYAERRRVLNGEDVHEHILGMIDDIIRAALDNYCNEHAHPEEWNLEGLVEYLEGNFLPAGTLRADELTDMGRDALAEQIKAAFLRLYEEKEKAVGSATMRELERVVLLRVVDQKWVDHLAAMDDLRDGIGLRAYGQRDPLLEYKFEAYEMFQQMIQSIKEDVVRILMHLEVRPGQAEPQRRRVAVGAREEAGRVPVFALAATGGGAEGADAGEAAGGAAGPAAAVAGRGRAVGAGAGAAPAAARREPVRVHKVGRNDPCPCGSGKKYKKCCGRTA
ncbi:preprotein translocase subunit SecA [Thermaerobacter sp. FW80]|uniref:preprotein translocase subunit SecA n=1 Tax=Thermaerobacter sp. FW80 TaxID=2546351 RepID=UPI00107503FA|nr:preprotein translocase subunit SecA [Thermaerobacter sp. FW80]QBS37233.1 preprotein translocase subunit SecA [Thermaerobacter sp. FW80]